MGEFVEGRYVPDEEQDILDLMIQDAEDYWDRELNESEVAVFRVFYRPVAARMASLQQDLAVVMDSAQIDNAQGMALDYLTALINVNRRDAQRATTELTFSRSDNADVDYPIPEGTVVQTDDLDPIRFQTTEKAVLPAGSSSISGVEAEAVEPGLEGNLAAEALRVIVTSVEGVSDVTNPDGSNGGEERENDENLRQRAKNQLSDGMRATPQALLNAVLDVEGVVSASIFINASSVDETDEGGLPDHHFELVVDRAPSGDQQEIIQSIVDVKAVADGTFGGAHGTEVSGFGYLDNGQRFPVAYSEPNVLKLTVDADIQTTEIYGGDNRVRDAITRYIGGILSSGDESDGELDTGDEVVYQKIQSAVMSVEGVHDITNLSYTVGGSASLNSNYATTRGEKVRSNSTDDSILINKERI